MSQCDLPDDRVNHYRGSHQQLIEKERDRLAVGQHPPEVQNDADVDHHRHGQKEEVKPRVIRQMPRGILRARRDDRDHHEQKSIRAEAGHQNGISLQFLRVFIDVTDEIGAVKNEQWKCRGVADKIAGLAKPRKGRKKIKPDPPIDHIAQKPNGVDRQHPEEIGAKAPARMTAKDHACIGRGRQDGADEFQYHADRRERIFRNITARNGVKGHDHQREHNTDRHKTANARSCSLVYPHSRVPPHSFDHKGIYFILF